MNSKIKTYIDASQKVSHRLGRIVPCLGTHRFMPWDASFHALGRIVSLLLLFLMLVLGGGNAWAQTDYSGTYYIKSESANKQTSTGDYYLCPTENWIYYKATNDFQEANNGQPFLTTYCKTSEDEAKYKWILEKHTVDEHDYYSFRYATDYNSQKRYLSFNGKIGNAGQDRIRLHLEIKDTPGDNELFEFLSYKTSPYLVIKPKLNDIVDNKEVTKYLVVNGGNKDSYKGESGKDGGPSNKYKYTAGIIGIYNDINDSNAPFSLEEIIDRPTFASTNKNEIVINHDAGANATIYYTTDGTNPTTTNKQGSGKAPLHIDMSANSVTLKAIAVIDNLPSCITKIRVVPNATITLESSSFTYNGSEQKPTVTVKDGNTTISTDEYTVGYSNNTNAGDATVTINNATGGSYIVYGSTSFTISPKTLTITAKQKSITYGDAPTNDGVLYSGFVEGENESKLTGTLAYAYNYSQYGDVGNTYTITPSGLTGDNYDISYVAGTLIVSQKEVGISWSETTTFPYDGNSHILIATATDLVNDDEIGVIVTGEQTNAGNHTATASELTGEKAGNYKLPTVSTHAFSITKVPLTVTAQNHSITYGDAPANNGVEYDGFVGGETSTVLGGSLDYDYSYTQYDDVGDNYTITPKGLTSNNYNISYVAGTLTVNPKALTITADAKEKAYGDDDPALTYTFEGLVGSDAITGALSRDAGENVGTYPINQNTLTASSNYTISYTGANLTINPKPLTITAKSKTITYGEEPTNDGVTYSEFAPGEDASDLIGTLTYAYNYSQYGDAGEYSITPSGLTGDNYDISYVAGTLTVNPKEVGLVWSETTSFVYDANSHAPTASATGMVNGDEIGVTVSGEQINAGDHIATASALTGNKAGNYALPAANTKAFSITPVALAVTAKNHIIIYGDTPGNNGVEYSGFVGEDNASMLGGSLDYAYSYAQYGDVGDDYTITPSGLTSTNYIISYHNGTLTVKKKTLGLNWTNTSFTYDREEHLPTVTIVGMVNGDEVSVTVTGPSAINAGDYIATASNLSGDKVDNYRLPTVTTQTFTISPKSLGDGDLPAEDITIKLTSEGELEYVKDGEITLTADDYTYEIHTEGSDQIVAVTGIGNYTGTLRGIYAQPKFYDVDGEGAGKAAAVYMSSRDINTFEGVNAYTVKSVNTFLGLLTVSKLEYIPKGVPVLLLSESEATGFVVSEKDEEIADISERTVNNNLLKMADADIPVETAQAYMFYLGEFVLTKAGTIKSGKFYILNPDYTDTSAGSGISSARRSLTIVEEEVTGMTDIPNTGNKSADDVWYTLDGRCLNGKPARKGLYIHQGRKTVIK